MKERYIDSREQLVDLCEQFKNSEWIAVDTEFVREKSYYALPCLVQLADTETLACVDIIALQDLQPLRELLFDTSIIKVLHAASQDLELFHDMFDDVPGPVFDTQLAATMLGYGHQASYAALVQSVFGVTLDKLHTRTDWSKRPLSIEQLHYAYDDVRYLGKLYLELKDALQEQGRQTWLQDDFAALVDARKYKTDVNMLWRRVSGASRLKGVQLAVLRELAAWREQLAQQQDKPRKWVLKDDTLVELARRTPDNTEALARIPGINESLLRRNGDNILKVISRAKQTSPEDWPKTVRPAPLDQHASALVDTMMAIVRLRGEEHGISPSQLAGRKQLESFVQGNPDADILEGWRNQIVGRDLQAFLDGALELRVVDGRLRLQPVNR
jgi:ribonuclease D